MTSHPLRREVRRDADPNEVAAGDPDDDETVQQTEADGGHDKEIVGSDAGSVIAQQCAPSLRRRSERPWVPSSSIWPDVE